MRFSLLSWWKQRLTLLHVLWVIHMDCCCSLDEAQEYVVTQLVWCWIVSCEYQSISNGICWSLPPALLHQLKNNHWCSAEEALVCQWWDKKNQAECPNTFLVPPLPWMLWSHPSKDWACGDQKCSGNKEVTLLLQIILIVPQHSPMLVLFFRESFFKTLIILKHLLTSKVLLNPCSCSSCVSCTEWSARNGAVEAILYSLVSELHHPVKMKLKLQASLWWLCYLLHKSI